MNLSEVFYLTGTITLVTITVLFGVLVYQIYLTLKALQSAMLQANNIAGSIKSVTSGVQFGFWALAAKLLGRVTGRG